MLINSSLTSFLCVLEQCQNNSKNTTLKSKSLGNYKEQKQNTNIKKSALSVIRKPINLSSLTGLLANVENFTTVPKNGSKKSSFGAAWPYILCFNVLT